MKIIPISKIKWVDEFHDSDWDNVPNFRDCNIFNPYEQGIHNIMERRRIKKKRKQREKAKYERQEMKRKLEHIRKQKPKRKKVSYEYVIAKIGNKWYNLGAFTVDGIERVIEEAKQMRGATHVITSTNKNEANRRNRERMLTQLETAVEMPFAHREKLSKEEFVKRTYGRR